MSRTHRFHLFAAAGLLGSTLTAPAMVQGQSLDPGRALLNYTAAIAPAANPGVTWSAGLPLDPAGQGEGEQALLGRRAAVPAGAASSVRRSPIGGELALLGREPEIE
jgi:hypothetical protein